jgi:hypothetical protein
MSFAESSGNDLITELDTLLEGTMPKDCYDAYKRFSLCKFDRNEEILKTKGLAYFKEYQTEPFARVEGCKNEYNKFDTCISNFQDRYYDMHNYIAEIEGKPPKFDKKKIEKEIKKNNIGLNKF